MWTVQLYIPQTTRNEGHDFLLTQNQTGPTQTPSSPLEDCYLCGCN